MGLNLYIITYLIKEYDIVLEIGDRTMSLINRKITKARFIGLVLEFEDLPIWKNPSFFEKWL